MSKVGSYWFCLISCLKKFPCLMLAVSRRLAVCVSSLLLLKSNNTLVSLSKNLQWSLCRVRAKFHLTKGIMTISDGRLKGWNRAREKSGEKISSHKGSRWWCIYRLQGSCICQTLEFRPDDIRETAPNQSSQVSKLVRGRHPRCARSTDCFSLHRFLYPAS